MFAAMMDNASSLHKFVILLRIVLMEKMKLDVVSMILIDRKTFLICIQCSTLIACDRGGVRCNNGECIPNERVCDTTEDCKRGEDEAGCGMGK